MPHQLIDRRHSLPFFLHSVLTREQSLWILEAFIPRVKPKTAYFAIVIHRFALLNYSESVTSAVMAASGLESAEGSSVSSTTNVSR